jgi:large subunit ribosomal protein L24
MMYTPPKKKGPRCNKALFTGKMRLRTGDVVRVIAGKDKGREGKITKVIPSSGKIVVEGINVMIKHERPHQQASASGLSGVQKQGGRIEIFAPISHAKVQLIDQGGKNAVTRIGIRVEADGTRVRFAKKSGSVIENAQ